MISKMAISAKDVNKLRQDTGAGMMDCKKALEEANGDFEAAIDILRKKGQKISAKRADKDASEGSVFFAIKNGGKAGYMIAMNCETDFVAKNEEYVALGSAIAETAASSDASSVDALKSESLSNGEKIEEALSNLMGKMGEKIEISAFEKLEGDAVVAYIHSNSKLGVLISLEGASGDAVEEIGRDVAMQIAAMNPVSIDETSVPQEVQDRELAVGREQAVAEGKPENIVDKIAEGRLKKFFKENTLVHQAFVKDGSKNVAQVLKEVDANLSVSAFKRVVIG